MTTGSETIECACCGRSFAPRRRVGRPPRYCGEVCRRTSEMELRRVQSLLRRASSKAQDAALALATGARFSEVTDRKVLEFWQGEIERLREEMRQLVAVETTNPQATRSYPTAS